jgi:hypothetical protein
MKPSVGRIVHYVSYGTPGGEYKSVCRAAVIAEVTDLGGPYINAEDLPKDPVTLCVLNPSGLFFNECEYDDDSHRGGTWHWPERVE